MQLTKIQRDAVWTVFKKHFSNPSEVVGNFTIQSEIADIIAKSEEVEDKLTSKEDIDLFFEKLMK
jgi:hypothetical protein